VELLVACPLSLSAFKISNREGPCAICSNIIKYKKLFSRFLSQAQITKLLADVLPLLYEFKSLEAAFDALSVSVFKITVRKLPCAICSNIIKYEKLPSTFSVSTSNPQDASLWYLSVSWGVQKSESSI
jgi:hypothetical protein